MSAVVTSGLYPRPPMNHTPHEAKFKLLGQNCKGYCKGARVCKGSARVFFKPLQAEDPLVVRVYRVTARVQGFYMKLLHMRTRTRSGMRMYMRACVRTHET